MKKKSAIKERRANITNYFLELVKEGSAQEIKTFFSYFSYDVNLLFEENLTNDTLNNPIRVAYIRGDPKIFNQIIKLNPNLFAKTQANDRALQYALQFDDVESATVLLLNRQNRELTIKVSNPNFNALFNGFKQLSKDEFASKYNPLNVECLFSLEDLPPELHCNVLKQLSVGLALNSRTVCKLWRDNIKTPSIVDNAFIKGRKFESYVTVEEYFLKIEVFPTVHHFCLADPKRILPRIAPRDYDDAYITFLNELIASAVTDCLDPYHEEALRTFIMDLDAEEIYYWSSFGYYALYLNIDGNFGIGITMQEAVEGNLLDLNDGIYG